MSTPEPCVTGVTLSDPTLCATLNKARTDQLAGPTIDPPTPIADELMPSRLRQAMTECAGSSTCTMIGYDFDTDTATKVTGSKYVVDTYSSSAENSGVLVSKGKKTSGTVSGVTTTATGGSTATVTYTADDNQVRTFQATWPTLQTSGATVDVYYDPANRDKAGLTPEVLGFKPPVLVEPPGYELPDFQSAPTTGTNKISSPNVTSVEECASQCDATSGCDGFNFGGIGEVATCELVKDATTGRVYADNTSGFRKEKAPSVYRGTNPPGVDFGNQGLYCQDAPACNADITRLMDSVGSGTNDIKTFSTSDIESCSFCPVRYFDYKNGRWSVRNEIGVTSDTGYKEAATSALQYSTDGTFATHITIQSGKFYDVGDRIVYAISENGAFKLFSWGATLTASSAYPQFEVPIFGFLYGNLKNVAVYNSQKLVYEKDSGNIVNVKDLGDHGTRNLAQKLDFMLSPPGGSYDLFTFVPVDYVTNGFRIVNSTGKAMKGSSTPSTFTRYDTDTVHTVLESTLNAFLGQIPNYPKVLFDGTRYVKVNSDGTADTGITYAPYTSTYSSEFTFCQVYSGISFDMSAFDWTDNWFTQTGKPGCDRQTKLVYGYKSALTVPSSFVPGFWDSITQFCANSCQAGTYAGTCTNGQRQCVTCTSGKYCPLGVTAEQECPFGYYCPTPSTMTACRPYGSSCPTGFTYVQDACQGTHSATNDRTKDLTCKAGICPDGYTWDGSQCIQCMNGGYKSGVSASGSAVACACPLGFTSLDCSTCGPDKTITSVIENGKEVGKACLPCPEGSSTKGLTNTTCTCNDGYGWSGSPLTVGQYLTMTGQPLLSTSTDSAILSGPNISGIGTGTGTTYSNPNDAPMTPLCIQCPVGMSCTNIPASGSSTTFVGCPAGQYIDTVTSSCKSCGITPGAGYVWQSPGKSCSLRLCLAGDYCPNATTEIQCTTAGYYCPAGSSSPIQCDLGYNCPAGSTTQTKCCVASTSTQTYCSNTLNPGYIWLNPRVDCTHRQCNAGYYCPNATTETVCTSGNYCPVGSTKQTQCQAGYYCPTPATQNICTVGNYCPAGSTSQTQCAAGYYCSTDATTRTQCSAGYSCPAGSTSQTACPFTIAPGNLWRNPGVDCATNLCSGGYYCPNATTETLCTAGNYCPRGSSSQTACTLGNYCPDGSVSQNLCDAGYYCPDTKTRTQCTVGYYNAYYCPAGSTSQGVCDAGYYCPDLTTRTQCSAGYYCPANSKSQTPCTSGNYCPAGSSSQTACTTCGGGTYETTACTTSQNRVCTTCEAGYYCTGGTARAACTTAGYYCPVGSSSATGTACQTCATNMTLSGCGGASPGTCVCSPGTVSIPPGSVTCVPTPVNGKCSTGEYVGTWSDGTQYCWSCGTTVRAGNIWQSPGVTCTVVACSAGSYCPNSTTQTQCSAGTYSLAGATSCTTCSTLGTYCPAGATQIVDCDAGYYCPSTSTRTQCTSGNYCPVRSTSQNICPAGYFCPSTTQKIQCVPTDYCPAGSTSENWCPGGTYCSTAATSTQCSAGYYCPRGSTSQTVNPASCYSRAGSSACIKTISSSGSTTVTFMDNAYGFFYGGASMIQTTSSPAYMFTPTYNSSTMNYLVLGNGTYYFKSNGYVVDTNTGKGYFIGDFIDPVGRTISRPSGVTTVGSYVIRAGAPNTAFTYM